MRTSLTVEQQQLQETAARLAAAHGVANPVDLETVDRGKVWSLLADSGVLGLRERGEDGRPLGSGVEVATVAEELGSALVPAPFLGNAVMATELLALAGSDWTAGISDGSTRYGILLTEDLSDIAAVDDPAEVATALGWDMDGADFVLAVSGSDRRGVVRIPVTGPVGSSVLADFTRSVAPVPIDPAALQTAGTLGAEDRDRWLALALVGICADSVGVMRGALSRAVAYSKERIAFGVPIASFQAIQHLCADALVQCEAAANHTRYAAWSIDEEAPAEALLRARTAKAYCAAAVRDVPETAAQVFGGMGHTWEHIAHFFLRRGLVDRELLGGEAFQLARIADVRFGAC